MKDVPEVISFQDFSHSKKISGSQLNVDLYICAKLQLVDIHQIGEFREGEDPKVKLAAGQVLAIAAADRRQW